MEDCKINEKTIDSTSFVLYNLNKEAVNNIIAEKLKRAKHNYDAHEVIRNSEKLARQYYLD